MELLQLRYFVSIATLESVTEAAKLHNIPQPAMSQMLSRLERELGGVKLFDRVNNRIYLNEDGQRFLNYIQPAIESIDSGIKAVSDRRGDVSGSIHLLVMENRRFVTRCVSTFAEKNPLVNFHICHDFYSGQDADYDLCIASLDSYKQMCASLPLIRESIVLAVHESHPLARHTSVRLTELKNEKFITMSLHSSLYNITFEKCRSNGFEPHVPFICDDPYFVRKYVSQNMGVALAPSLSWAGRFRENTKLIPIDDPPVYSTSYLLWNDRRYLSRAADTFRIFLKQEASKLENNLL